MLRNSKRKATICKWFLLPSIPHCIKNVEHLIQSTDNIIQLMHCAFQIIDVFFLLMTEFDKGCTPFMIHMYYL